MATAEIFVDGVAGRPATQSTVGATVALTNANNTGVTSWQWTLVFAPAGSTATITPGTTVPDPSCGPLDRAGTYHLRLAVNGASGHWQTDIAVDEVVIRVPLSTGIPGYIPAVGETAQAGSQGWADETTGVNETLSLLLQAFSLQGAYDYGPAIAVSAALGPVSVTRDVIGEGAGDVLRMGSAIVPDLFVVHSSGRVAMAGDASAGDTALSITTFADPAHSGNIFSAQNPAGARGFTVSATGSVFHQATGDAYGFHGDYRASIFGLFFVENVAAVNPTDMRIDGAGSLITRSDSAVDGAHIYALNPTSTIARFQRNDVAGHPVQFAVDRQGQVQCRGRVGDYAIDADMSMAAVGIARLADSARGTSFVVSPRGLVTISADQDPGGDVSLHLRHVGIAGDGRVLEIDTAVADLFYMRTAGEIYHEPEVIGGAVAFPASIYEMNLATIASVKAGEVLYGFHVSADPIEVQAGGTFRGVVVHQSGTTAGNANSFSGVLVCAESSQDAVQAYAVRTGGAPEAGSRYVGRDNFSAADCGPRDPEWVPQIPVVSGVGPHMVATLGKKNCIIPVHVPPRAIITGFSVRVYGDGGAGGLNVHLLRTNAVAGADAQNATFLATASTVGAGTVDLAVSELSEVVPSSISTPTYAYAIVIESAVPNDKWYSGFVDYTYGELLSGD